MNFKEFLFHNHLFIHTSRVNKIIWSLFFLLLTAIIFIIYQTYPISISHGIPSVMQIPTLFWIFCIIVLVVWVKIFLNQKNPRLLLIGVVSYYFILFCSNLMFVSPYEQTDRISSYISILDNSASIGQSQIEMDNYFQWPIFFLLTKTFLLVGDLTINQVLQIGFYSINLILPIILLFMYKARSNESDKNYILPVIIYILVSYTFIVNQFAPQALALLLLFLTYALYLDLSNPVCEKKTFRLGILFFIFTILVLTHPFMFLFFLVPLAIDYFYKLFIRKKEGAPSHGRTIILLTIIYFTGLLYRYMSIQNNIIQLIELIGSTGGESWRLLFTLFNTGSEVTITPSYYPLLENTHFLISNALKIIILLTLIIIFYLFIKNPNARKCVGSLDIAIVITSFGLYLFGLFSIFLGQRGVQVAISSMVKVFNFRMNRLSIIIRCAIVLIIIITPVLLVTTSLTNIARSGESFIEDQEINIAGHFVDEKIAPNSNVLLAESIYPVNRPLSGFNKYSNLRFVHENNKIVILDYLLITPKLTLQTKYFGYDYLLNEQDGNRIYSNGASLLVQIKL